MRESVARRFANVAVFQCLLAPPGSGVSGGKGGTRPMSIDYNRTSIASPRTMYKLSCRLGLFIVILLNAYSDNMTPSLDAGSLVGRHKAWYLQYPPYFPRGPQISPFATGYISGSIINVHISKCELRPSLFLSLSPFCLRIASSNPWLWQPRTRPLQQDKPLGPQVCFGESTTCYFPKPNLNGKPNAHTLCEIGKDLGLHVVLGRKEDGSTDHGNDT